MQKKILIAVDNSPHSRGAIDYAAQMNQLIPELGFTLFHVQPPISQFLLEEAMRDAQARVELKKIAARNAEASESLLGSLKEVMLRTGVAAEAVEIMAQPRQQGVAKDILDFAQSSLYDAILVGRRGIGGLQKLFMGSVSAHLIENSPLIPVWMVDGKVFSTHVMAAVDGSESALRAVDHLAFILSGVPEARVCFFHVTPRLKDFCEVDFSRDQSADIEALITRGDRRCMDDFFSAAMDKLRAAGFEASQIETRTAATLVSIGETILKAAREGGFGSLVMGRRGVNKSFFGGKTSYLVSRDISDAALWMVP
jgi:nucleotide-binding universal stress UspA family protein